MKFNDLRIGDKLRTNFGNSLDRTYHVRGFVDGMVVLRNWSRTKQRWYYSVESPEWFLVFEPRLIITKGDKN